MCQLDAAQIPEVAETVNKRAAAHQFILHVTRPWNRDPTFYLSALLEIAFTDSSLAGEALETFRAHEALTGFRDWLTENRAAMDGENGVGKAALDWFAHNGLLLPWTSDELLVLGQREFDRLWGFYGLERHRNRGLPEIKLPTSAEEYLGRLASTDKLIRTWLVEDEVITIPDFIPKGWQEMGYNVPWRVRDTGPNFWEAVQFRDPSPDHLHAVIPGHRFDGWVARNLENPIRRHALFGVRREGWAVYLEEGMMQAGVLEDRPRTRELIYAFGIWRASRTVGDILNQQNVMSAAETAEWWVEVTPMLDPDVARKYAHVRPLPGHGLQYTIGAVQIFVLLGARKRQLREDFVLKDFHDQIMTMVRIPVVLIWWQMTGEESVVKTYWEEEPLEALLAGGRS